MKLEEVAGRANPTGHPHPPRQMPTTGPSEGGGAAVDRGIQNPRRLAERTLLRPIGQSAGATGGARHATEAAFSRRAPARDRVREHGNDFERLAEQAGE